MKTQALPLEPLVVAGTGHRPDNRRPWRGVGDWSNTRLHAGVRSWLGEQLDELKPATVISGLALGVDTWLALEALLRGIHVVGAMPFEGQERTWPKEHQAVYRTILERAEVVNVSGCRVMQVGSGTYFVSAAGAGIPSESLHFKASINECMQKRNEWMVDRCRLVLSVWDGTPGGTGNCMRYVERVGRDYRRLNPNALR